MKRLFLVILIVVAASACDMPTVSRTGSIDLSINNNFTRTILPAISMDASSFQIRGIGPEGGSFTLDTLTEQNLIEQLTPGNWTIEADAYNSNSTLIGFGSTTLTVVGGETLGAYIAVTPLTGTGTLDLSLFWDPLDVAVPYISASLIPASGFTQTLVFTETESGIGEAAEVLEAGYYTLIMQLLDSDTVVMGTAEAVRIVSGQNTSGSFDFTDVNSLDGSIDIGIDVDLNVPIDIELTGNLSSLALGESMTVTASSPAETETITYDWYLNGSPLGSGLSFSVGTSLNPGFYRLDIIAFNDDLTRSGSVSHSFTVTE